MRYYEFKKQTLLESLSHEYSLAIINKFLNFAKDKLKLDNLPKIVLHSKSDRSVEYSSFASYGNGIINLSISNRHINDCLRSLAHEIVHYKQDMNNELDQDSGNDGSPHENEANAMAGVLMREWGKMYPQLFAQYAVE